MLQIPVVQGQKVAFSNNNAPVASGF